MAIRILCRQCGRQVSVDDAFAGGMCRCPYCKAINHVPEQDQPTQDQPRPAEPAARPKPQRAKRASQAPPSAANAWMITALVALLLVALAIGVAVLLMR